jgi:hypothetical protein
VLLGYTFWQVIWSMFVFFLWIIWIWLLITVFIDLFRRHDIGGWAKAGWAAFILLLPFLGVLVYLIAEGRSMGERTASEMRASQADFDSYVQTAAASASDPAEQIAKGKRLLDSGAITQAEFDSIKQKALAS